MHEQYLSYSEYVQRNGTIPETEFQIAEFKARKRIDYWTDSRVQNMEEVPEAVKLCIVALIAAEKKIGAEAQAASPLLSSFNNDGYSESYGSAADQAAAINTAVKNQIRQLLYGETDDEGTPLLYRGLMG